MEEKQFGNEKNILQVNYVKRSSFKFLTWLQFSSLP
jgi:hypothetical protein